MTAPNWTRETFIDVPGGRVWCAVAGDGPGIPLVVLHGGPGLPSDYLFPLAALSDVRPVVFYDQLGCGRSDRPAFPGLWRIERFVAELSAVRQALDLDMLHLIGHSWGSMLAIDYVLTRPAGVVSLVLASPAISIPRWIADSKIYRAGLPPAMEATLTRHETQGTLTDPDYDRATRAYYDRHVCRLSPSPDELERANEGFGALPYGTMWGANEFNITGNLSRYDRSGRLKEITIPSLLTCGRYDEATPETTAWYSSLLVDFQIAIFEESAHMPHLEERERYLALVRGFLRDQDRALVNARMGSA